MHVHSALRVPLETCFPTHFKTGILRGRELVRTSGKNTPSGKQDSWFSLASSTLLWWIGVFPIEQEPRGQPIEFLAMDRPETQDLAAMLFVGSAAFQNSQAPLAVSELREIQTGNSKNKCAAAPGCDS